jgi:hypothetical protein
MKYWKTFKIYIFFWYKATNKLWYACFFFCRMHICIETKTFNLCACIVCIGMLLRRYMHFLLTRIPWKLPSHENFQNIYILNVFQYFILSSWNTGTVNYSYNAKYTEVISHIVISCKYSFFIIYLHLINWQFN